MKADYKKILIIKPSSLGDIIHALPVAGALRKGFGNAKISWLIRDDFAPILNNHPSVHEVILFKRKLLSKAWYNPKAVAALLQLINHLRRQNFDVVIDLQGLFRTASLSLLSGAKESFGMAGAREFAHFFYNHKVSQNTESIHVVDYYLKIAQEAGADISTVEFALPNNRDADRDVKNLLSASGVDARNYAVFVPMSRHRNKCWPTEKFAALAEKIYRDFKLDIIATGTKAEINSVQRLVEIADAPVVNLAGKTDLLQLTALMRNAKLVIANDTGPAHIAAAANVGLVIIFGVSNPARVGPYKRPQSIAAREPFGRGLEVKSSNPAYNIELITVEEVYEKAARQLKQAPLS